MEQNEKQLAKEVLKHIEEAQLLCDGPSKVYDILEETRYSLLDLLED